MQSPVSDPLSDRLAISVLAAAVITAAGTTTSATKTPASVPLSAAAVLIVPSTPAAADTLTIKVQGRNLDTDAWADTAVFAVANNGSHAEQRVNLTRVYSKYQVVCVAAGTFGATATTAVAYTVALVGTDVRNAPIVQS